MTNNLNCSNQQPPSYSGVTINITNPALNIPPQCSNPHINTPNVSPYAQQYNNQALQPIAPGYPAPLQYQNPTIQPPAPGYQMNNSYLPGGAYNGNTVNNPYSNNGSYPEPVGGDYNGGTQNINNTNIYQTVPNNNGLPQAYPPQYYLNNYDNQQPTQTIPILPAETAQGSELDNTQNNAGNNELASDGDLNNNTNDDYTAQNNDTEEINTDTSKAIIEELDVRQAEQKELEKNGKKTKIVSLTNEYIMSLENYLNNPNTDIRLMAAKEVLTRFDEDKSRYDDAALNALLNKMLQDPNKLVRIAALSALASELASGNDYTVQLLNQIQQNPEADPEDVLEASQILLKRAATTEVVYAPVNNQPQPQPQQQEVQEQE